MNSNADNDLGPSFSLPGAWLGLSVVYSGFLAVGFVFHFVPPVLPAMMEDLGLTHGQGGLLMSLYALPGILLSFTGGWLADRFGERVVGSLGLAGMGAGTLVLAAAADFTLILAARAISGVGVVMAVIAMQRMVTRLFAGRSLGVPMGVSGSAIPLGIIVVLNLAGPVAAEHGWREVAMRVGWFGVAAAGVFLVAGWLLMRGRKPDPGGEQVMGRSSAAGLKKGLRAIWIIGVVWFCANGAMTAFMTFAPDFFKDLGMGIGERGLTASIPMWAAALLGPVSGWLADRYGGKAAFVACGMTLMAVCLALVPTGSISPGVLGFGLGIALAFMVTPTMSLPGSVLPPSHIGRGFGILSTLANLGIFFVPPLAGFARDLTGAYAWAFWLMGMVAAVGVAAAEILRRGRFTPGFRLKPRNPACEPGRSL